jgi:methylmalonyl-CoA mutase N-terminal domain/subunit
MKETFGAKDPRSWLCRFHTQTAGVSLTAQQPENNIVRVAIQALAAVLGGTQSLHTNSMDEAWALPSEDAATIALRTQQVIAEESGVVNTVDPLAGSFFVEHETNKIEQQVYDYWQQVEALGGVLPAIEQGFYQSEISSAAYLYQRETDDNERVIVGVNGYVDEDEDLRIPILQMDPEGYDRQVNRLKQLRAERDNERVEQTLNALRNAAEGNDNTMPYILDAVRAYATLGEITDLFREVFGEYREPTWI